MEIESGNLDQLAISQPEKKGWFVGSFIEQESLRNSDKCEVKWAKHQKGLKKIAGQNLKDNCRSVVILISGRWLTRFTDNNQEIILSKPGDYLVYQDGCHENEALEDSCVIVIRWPTQN